MGRPVSVNIPHQLGKDEARRRIADGFSQVQRQLGGGLLAAVSMTERWEGDRLHFEGGGLGQKLTGRLDVLADSVQVQLDLPEILAALAERITGRLTQQTRELLEKK